MRIRKTVFMALLLVLLGISAAKAMAEGSLKTHTNSIGMQFMLIPAGSAALESAGNSWGKHAEREMTVTVSHPFYLSAYEVTQEQWMAVMGPGNNPSQFKGPHHPVEHVSWDEAQEFIRRLNAMEGHERYRLPTENEWRFAVLSGAETSCFSREKPKSWAEAKDFFDADAWFYANPEDPTHPVGRKRANRYGLYDLLGNVYEWVQNRDTASPRGPADVLAPAPRFYQVHGGDSWRYLAGYCRLEYAVLDRPDPRFARIGLRMALTPK